MITINFINPNSRTLTLTAVYRTDISEMIPDEPDYEPIAILDGFVDTFVDHDTELGRNYNYRFKSYRPGGESVMSRPVTYGDVSLYGPGPYESAVSGTKQIWELGDVNQSEYMPSFKELEPIAGPNAEYIGWSGVWRKFRIGSSIYLTPRGGAIHIHPDDLLGMLKRVGEHPTFDNEYMSYYFAIDVSAESALSLFDGCYPTLWSMRKEYPRKDALTPYAGTAMNSRMIFSVTNETNGQMLVKTASKFTATTPSWISADIVNYRSYNWYWKPIFQMVPKIEVN